MFSPCLTLTICNRGTMQCHVTMYMYRQGLPNALADADCSNFLTNPRWEETHTGLKGLEKLLRRHTYRERFVASCVGTQHQDASLFKCWNLSIRSLRWEALADFTAALLKLQMALQKHWNKSQFLNGGESLREWHDSSCEDYGPSIDTIDGAIRTGTELGWESFSCILACVWACQFAIAVIILHCYRYHNNFNTKTAETYHGVPGSSIPSFHIRKSFYIMMSSVFAVVMFIKDAQYTRMTLSFSIGSASRWFNSSTVGSCWFQER